MAEKRERVLKFCSFLKVFSFPSFSGCCVCCGDCYHIRETLAFNFNAFEELSKVLRLGFRFGFSRPRLVVLILFYVPFFCEKIFLSKKGVGN